MIDELACSTECEVSVSYCVPPTEEIHKGVNNNYCETSITSFCTTR